MDRRKLNDQQIHEARCRYRKPPFISIAALATLYQVSATVMWKYLRQKRYAYLDCNDIKLPLAS